MAERPEDRAPEIKLDPAALYLEEVFTDRRIGTIRRLTPVKGDGTRDPKREITYIGETQVMSTVVRCRSVRSTPPALEEAAQSFGPGRRRRSSGR